MVCQCGSQVKVLQATVGVPFQDCLRKGRRPTTVPSCSQCRTPTGNSVTLSFQAVFPVFPLFPVGSENTWVNSPRIFKGTERVGTLGTSFPLCSFELGTYWEHDWEHWEREVRGEMRQQLQGTLAVRRKHPTGLNDRSSDTATPDAAPPGRDIVPNSSSANSARPGSCPPASIAPGAWPDNFRGFR